MADTLHMMSLIFKDLEHNISLKIIQWNVRQLVVVVGLQFLSGVVPLPEMAGFTPISFAIACTSSFHWSRFRASSFFKPIYTVSSSTCFFQVFFGRPRFVLPLTSRSRATVIALPSSLLSSCQHHLTPSAVANWSIVSFNPNMFICSSVVFLSTTF